MGVPGSNWDRDHESYVTEYWIGGPDDKFPNKGGPISEEWPMMKELRTRPKDIRCVEIRTAAYGEEQHQESNFLWLYTDGNPFGTFQHVHMHSWVGYPNVLEDIIWRTPEGLDGIRLDAWITGKFRIWLRVWRRKPNIPAGGWVVNPSTIMDLDRRRG